MDYDYYLVLCDLLFETQHHLSHKFVVRQGWVTSEIYYNICIQLFRSYFFITIITIYTYSYVVFATISIGDTKGKGNSCITR